MTVDTLNESLGITDEWLNRGSTMILSSSLEEALVGEYHIVMYKYFQLKKLLYDWDEISHSNISLLPSCSKDTVEKQLEILERYRTILERRAVEEYIDLLI